MRDIVLNHFKNNDLVLYEISKQYNDINITSNKDCYFYDLVESIISQQLSGKAAATIFKRFQNLFSSEINPLAVLKIPDEKLRSTGISKAKVSYIKDLAKNILEKKLDLENVNKLSDEVVINELIKVKGIGRWTAEMFLIFSLGREDIFSFGDLGLKNAIRNLYQLENPTKEEIEVIINKWSPYKTYGCLILWRSLNNEPSISKKGF